MSVLLGKTKNDNKKKYSEIKLRNFSTNENRVITTFRKRFGKILKKDKRKVEWDREFEGG